MSATLKIEPDRLHSLWVELHSWVGRDWVTRRQVQILIGKLQFVCVAIRPGRLFISRLIRLLKGDRLDMELDEETRKDIKWWLRFMPQFNGSGILWMDSFKEQEVMASDASLTGLGAVFDKEYWKIGTDLVRQDYTIVHLELLAVVIMFKVWGHLIGGRRVLVECDNEA